MADSTSNGYLEVFLNSALSEGEALGPLALLFLFLARFLPIIQLSPFFGAKLLPNPVKLALAISLFVIFLPKLLTVTTIPIGFNLYTVMLIAKELVMGYIIGYLISIPFIIVQSAGIIIDHQRGGAALMVNDPTIQNQSSPLGTLFNYTLIFVFFAIDAPFLFIDAIMLSYDVVPPDQFFNSSLFAPDTPFWLLQVGIMGQVVTIATQLATPALLIMLMTDLFLGIANRLAPQVQITFLGMSLKSLLGLLVVTLGWSLLVGQFQKQSLQWIQVVKDALTMIQFSYGTSGQ
ncbi:MAG: flagellar biosynthetic protein FliR [Chlamydiia bacterium]|nr:flagellar biosynthetic protein FliR [Chlamydiia bacterium]